MELILKETMRGPEISGAETGITVKIPLKIFVTGILTFMMCIIGMLWMIRKKNLQEEDDGEDTHEDPKEGENEECLWICGTRPEVYHLTKACGNLNRRKQQDPPNAEVVH